MVAPRPRQRVHVELEQARRIEAKDLRARVFGQTAHLALDRFRRMRPAALVMRIVVRPQEVVSQIVFHRQIEPDRIFLERRTSVARKYSLGSILSRGSAHM